MPNRRGISLKPEDLEKKKIVDLREIAKSLDIASPYKYKKYELIECILKKDKNKDIEEIDKKEKETIDLKGINMKDLSDKATEEMEQLDNINMAEGILEIHQDGYGFLRRNNYQSGDNDIYLSNSQIRRFRMRTGDKISGVVRPAKQGEKFKALLYVKGINDLDPETAVNRSDFDSLIPI